MLSAVEEYLYPKTIDETVKLLNEKPNSRIVAGGTNIGLLSDDTTKTLIDIQKVPLNYLKITNNTLEIGALATITDILEYCKQNTVITPVFVQALSNFANTQIRNMATIGGNIAHSYGWAIIPVLLLGFNALIHITGKNGSRVVSSDEFFAKHPRIEAHELITQIKIPITKNLYAAYDKLVRTVTDYALINCLVSVEKTGQELTNIHICIASVVKSPQRLVELEKQLKTLKLLSDDQIKQIVQKEVDKLTLVTTPIASEKYRREVLVIKLTRCICAVKNGGS